MNSARTLARYLVVAALSLLGTGAFAREAHAQSIVRRPGDSPNYKLELEVYGSIAAFEPIGGHDGAGLGLGVRATIPILREGFVKSINDSVAIGFGGDVVDYVWGHSYGGCVTLLGGTTCGSATVRGDVVVAYFPVVLQWNFWLTRHWSVFAEPGIAPYFRGRNDYGDTSFSVTPVFNGGARYRFNDKTNLVIRVGYPMLTIGVSFFLG